MRFRSSRSFTDSNDTPPGRSSIVEEKALAKVSIIIPVYNGEAYLAQNLESLACQTCGDFEVIYVDDGSTDQTPQILRDFGKNDPRFTLLQQAHSTAGDARNLGLQHATGEYCLFLDADDFFDPDLLQASTAAADQADADITLYTYDRYHNADGTFIPQPNGLQTRWIGSRPVFSRQDLPDLIFNVSTICAWTKLFRRSFLTRNGLAFQSLHNSNDIFFVLLSMAKADRIAWVNRTLVHYRIGIKGNLQSSKGKSPCDFVTAYIALGDALRRDGLYEQVAASYHKALLSSFTYNVRGAQFADIREAIYHRFLQPDVQSLHLTDCSEQDCLNPDDRNVIAGFMLAMKRQEAAKMPVAPAKVLRTGESGRSPCVSVIVPVYRTEAYLRECLDSFVHQTLQEIEMICVNDGSDDHCEDILLEYAAADSRITVLSQPNQGVSTARNAALMRAKGEYLYFCDSDDYLELDAMEQLYREAKVQNADMVIFNGQSFFENEELKTTYANYLNLYQHSKSYGDAQNGQALFEQLMINGEYLVSPCLYIVNRDYLLRNGFRFLQGVEYEDNLFTFQVLITAERAVHKHETYYHRRVRNHSIITEKVTFPKVYSYFTIYNALFAFISAANLSEVSTHYASQLLNSLLATTKRMYAACPPPEQYGYLALDMVTRHRFDALIMQPVQARNAFLRQEKLLETTRKQLNQANCLLPKPSLPRRAFRLLKKGLHSLRQNGFRVTCKKTCKKIIKICRGR